jgi:hypothetical protein
VFVKAARVAAILLSLLVVSFGAEPLRFQVTLDPALASHTVSGRLLVFLTARKPSGERLQTSFIPGQTWVAAMEIEAIKSGESVAVDSEHKAYPNAFSKAPAGEYWAMALLDPDHTYAYHGEDSGDLYGPIVHLAKLAPSEAGTIQLVLNKAIPESKLTDTESIKYVDFVSPILSAFYGRPIHMHAGVVVPADFEKDAARTFPAAYVIHGFSGNQRVAPKSAERIVSTMKKGELSDMVYVYLDGSWTTGHHEFADSANNGPWGRALTEDFIPYLEKRFHLIAAPNGRFLTGHSSGGWSSLWLQVTYPDFFGGTWSTSPDPADFRSFTGVDVTYGSKQNFYLTPEGKPINIARMNGQNIASIQEFVSQEEVVGDYGGQIASFEWVFSPRGQDGRPMKLFNRVTGEMDPAVQKAWEKYNIRLVLDRNWDVLGPKLKGKLHLVVGDQDTFHLEVPTEMLCDFLKTKGEQACEIVPGRDHMDLYREYKTYPRGLARRIDEQMRQAAGTGKTD